MSQTFDESTVEAIAALFGVDARKAPFEVPKLPSGAEGQPATQKAPVYQMTVPSTELGQPLLLTLWPSLSRVDVRAGKSYWALRGITSVELYPGVEVLFRRDDPPGMLFVSVLGRVALVA
jgi:hypothetical protein